MELQQNVWDVRNQIVKVSAGGAVAIVLTMILGIVAVMVLGIIMLWAFGARLTLRGMGGTIDYESIQQRGDIL